MLFFLLVFTLLVMVVTQAITTLIIHIVRNVRANSLLESINSKEDLIYVGSKDFTFLVMELFKRKGCKVCMTNKCGEDSNGMIINDLQFIEVIKYSAEKVIEVETAMKLAKCMENNSIYRGMLITLGDFKQNTKQYCHKSVIECINGDRLVEMCKEVQKKKPVLETG